MKQTVSTDILKYEVGYEGTKDRWSVVHVHARGVDRIYTRNTRADAVEKAKEYARRELRKYSDYSKADVVIRDRTGKEDNSLKISAKD